VNTSEVIGLAASIVGLATISILIINGGKTAQVIGATGKAFTDSIKAATLR
jgi:hypothetical protein